MTMDPGVIARDRKQGFFAQSFLAFSDKLISQNRIQNGIARLKQHRDLFAKVEKQYGVPGPVIAAFWALESDYGVLLGKLPVLRSLATLAYDCRRPDMFRAELMDALRIIDRGDLTPEEMIGSWAGELGQTQFLPSHYLKHAVDYDGDGQRNLITQRSRRHRLHAPISSRISAGSVASRGSRRCACPRDLPGRRPTLPSSTRAPNGPAGA